MYRTNYRCTDCKSQFEKITKTFPKKDPACPQCKESKKVKFKSSVSDNTHNLDSVSRMQDMIDSRKAPAYGGTNLHNKAIDKTAEIVMQDYGMTNLEMGSHLRPGDNCVPKLAPELEQKVDKVFAPQPSNVMGAQSANLNNALMRQINAGVYKGQSDVVRRNQEVGVKIPTNILHDYQPPAKKPN